MAEKIIKTEYSEEMQKSYMNYSMSVITARAIPDARDGLKPVQRRVLYDMSFIWDTTSLIESRRVSSAIRWVSIIPTVTVLSMKRWLSCHRCLKRECR